MNVVFNRKNDAKRNKQSSFKIELKDTQEEDDAVDQEEEEDKLSTSSDDEKINVKQPAPPLRE